MTHHSIETQLEAALPRRWRVDDQELLAVSTLLGVKPDIGLALDFGTLEERGRFKGVCTIGDYIREWLTFKLMEQGRLEAHSAPSATRGQS